MYKFIGNSHSFRDISAKIQLFSKIITIFAKQNTNK